MEIFFQDNKLIIRVQPEVYSLDVVHKCFYWYTERFYVSIGIVEKGLIQIELSGGNLKDLPEADLESLKILIGRNLVDYKLRDIVSKETMNVRDLFIAKAFASFEE